MASFSLSSSSSVSSSFSFTSRQTLGLQEGKFSFTSRQTLGLQEGKWHCRLPSKAPPQYRGSKQRAGAPHGATVGSPRSTRQDRPRSTRQDRPRSTRQDTVGSPRSTRQDRPRSTRQDRPRTPSRKRFWKEGEFPGIADSSTASPPRTPIKNQKKKMDDKRAAKAWVPTVTECFSERIGKMQWQEALEVFQMLKEQPFYEPKAGTYMKLFVLLGKFGQPYRALELFHEMVEEGCEPSTELYTALLSAYCRSKLLDDAFAVLEKMKALPLCQPDVFTYSTLIKACVEASEFGLVDSLFKEMSEREITPNTVTQNIVLGGYGRTGRYDEMEQVLNEMLESTSSKPDVWTMNIVLGLFANTGQIETMEKWYEKFRNIGIEPESRTFNIIMGAYGKKKMYEKMTAVMEYMRKMSYPWTTSTYNNVIEAFADAGDVKNMECAFEQMRAECMKADTKTFCCLINGYGNAGLFHKVVSSIQLAERLDIVMTTSFFNSVISACAKAKDLMEMERVYQRMKKKQCQPDDETYAIMTQAYQEEGMYDKIYDLDLERSKVGSNSVAN